MANVHSPHAPEAPSNPFDAFDDFASALPAADAGPPPQAPSSVAPANPFDALDAFDSAPQPTPIPASGSVATAPSSPFDAFDVAHAVPAAGPSPAPSSPASADGGEDFPFDLWGAGGTPAAAKGPPDVPVPPEDQKGLELVDADLEESARGKGATAADDTALEGIGWGGAYGPTAYRDEINRKNQGGGDGETEDAGDPHRDIAPPPPLKTKGRRKSEILSVQAMEQSQRGGSKAIVSALPDCQLVVHSGHVLTRLSVQALRTRSWKQAFWIQYGPTAILFFRSFADYENWLYNPYHTNYARNQLVKMRVDFARDVDRELVAGYQITEAKQKTYGKSEMMHFKLERWTADTAPTIAGAFAANQSELALSQRSGAAVTNDVAALRRIMVACLRRARRRAAVAKVPRLVAAAPGPGEAGGRVVLEPGATKGDLKGVAVQRLAGMHIAKSNSGRRMSIL